MSNLTFRGVEDLFIDAATNNTINLIGGCGGSSITEINQQNLTATSVSGTYQNTIVGTGSFNDTSNGDGNTVLGYYNLNNNTTGNYNTAIGWNVLQANTTGESNIGIGQFCLVNSTTKSANIAIGTGTMQNVNGDTNIGIGGTALNNITGDGNIGIGGGSLNYITGYNNIGIGFSSMNGFTNTGSANIAIGSSCLQNVSGSNNIAIGSNAGVTSNGLVGDNNILLGLDSSPSTDTVSNEITLGNSNISTLRCQATVITSLSDYRDKTDIDKLEVGLDFVEKLNPVTFKWDKRDNYENRISDGSKKDNTVYTGFIAQELKQLQDDNNLKYLNLVYENNPDKLEAAYGNLIPILVKAIKDLSLEVKELKSKLV